MSARFVTRYVTQPLYSILQCVAQAPYSMLQSVAVYGSALQCVAGCLRACCVSGVLLCIAVLQCVAVLQYVNVCFRAMLHVTCGRARGRAAAARPSEEVRQLT